MVKLLVVDLLAGHLPGMLKLVLQALQQNKDWFYLRLSASERHPCIRN